MNPEQSNISNVDSSLVEMVQAATKSNPSLARELATFLLDKTPDSQQITEEQHPVFFEGTQNPRRYSYVPKSGIGVHKDGTKLTAFDYEVSSNTRSKDSFGEDIERAKIASDIYALEDIIVSAYGDLVISGNDDMTSYLFLCREAIHCLSDKVKEAIGDLQYKGGVALALVTELVATSSTAEELFKAAVAPRNDDAELSGIEAMNEANVAKVYAALTPSVQTKGILLNNGVDVNSPWAQVLIGKAPNLDKLVNMSFDTLSNFLPSSGGAQDEACNKTDLSVVHQMYSGMLGQPMAADVPPVRRYMLENGLDLGAAQQLEKSGYDDLSSVTDKEIYNVTSKISSNVDDLSTVASKLMRARQSSLKYKLSENTDDPFSKKHHATTKYGRKKKTVPMGNKLRGKQVGSTLTKMVAKTGGGVKGSLATNAVSLLGKGASVPGASSILGKAGGMMSASALMGPVAVALALAPVLNEIAEDNARRLNQDMAETVANRQGAAAEVAALLASVSDISSESDAEKQQLKAKELLNAVKKPDSFLFSKMQGMGLQRQLEAMGTEFTPSTMAALPPYQNDADLVAAVDSGRALSAVSIFMEVDAPISTPDRQLLQTPSYVKMMGTSQPFQTQTHRTTSEKEAISFIKSAAQTGFSMAEKSTSSSSSSSQVKTGSIFGGGKRETSTASSTEKGKKESYSNDAEHKQEEKMKVTQAVVSEFTFMPMQTVNLSAGGLILSRYAYYRIQNIVTSKPAMTYKKTLDFLHDFGSHVPFGVQTLGGVFIRKMTITSREAASVTEMYSAASSQLTTTNGKAAGSSVDTGARLGIFGLAGAGANNSTGISSAASNGETTVKTSSAGSGQGTKDISASFRSSVTCYGPNAATQDMMYQQLMSNNRTWTVIDRGEAGSYFAIWDLLDYIGQGGIFREQCKLLREVWEGKALQNATEGSDLLKTVMTNYEVKTKFFNFIDALIASLAPAHTPGIFTGALADQFEAVIRAAVACQLNAVSDDPLEFISAGFASLSGSQPLSGAKRKHNSDGENKTNSPIVRKFEIVAGTSAYHYAKRSMNEFTCAEWAEFSYYTAIYRSAILEKGKPYYLLTLCRTLSEERSSSWSPLIKALLRPPQEEDDADPDHTVFHRDLDRSLQYKDSITGRNCLHYVLFSQDKDLITSVFDACPTNTIAQDNDGKSPFMLASESDELCGDSGVYDHLKKLIAKCPKKNIALNRPTSQSSTYKNRHSENAVNGNILGEDVLGEGKNISSTVTEEDAWWQVELDGESIITSIILENRCKAPGTANDRLEGKKRLQGFRLEFFHNGAIVHTYNDITPFRENPGSTIILFTQEHLGSEFIVADRMKISIPGKFRMLHLTEVQIVAKSFVTK